MSEDNTPKLSESYSKTRAEAQAMHDELIANSQEATVGPFDEEPQK